ncbi:MAG: PIN domain-containing protein [Planctomycetota bacterium]|nr:PIN domain-containing protein [Planctomycetota bacterium]
MSQEAPKSTPPSDLDTPLVVPEDVSTDKPLVIFTVRLLYLVLMITASILPFASITNPKSMEMPLLDSLAPFLATIAVATLIVLLDLKTPRKQLSVVVAMYLAVLAGLLAALAISALIDLIADAWDLPETSMALKYLTLLKLATGITLCYLAVSLVLSTRDDIRLVIPYVEFSKQVRGIRPMLLDTSVLIDGRYNAFCQRGFLDAPAMVPRCVIDELHRLSDSSDRLKRERGRRGMSNLRSLQQLPEIRVSIEELDAKEGMVDQALMDHAEKNQLRLVTTDSNLLRVAEIRRISTLNLHDLSIVMQESATPGQQLSLEIIRAGEEADQGIAYLPDGTMVVIEGGGDAIGRVVEAVVTNTLQTSAGRMVFARIAGTDGPR